MLGVGGVGLFCGRVHLQTRETKEKPRETKEKPRETKETKKTPSINKRNTFQSMGVSSINRIPF
jgi:hypothetical protein